MQIKRQHIQAGGIALIGLFLLVGVWKLDSAIRTQARAQSQALRQQAIAAALNDSTSSITVTYDLLDGWNFVALPVEVAEIETALDLIRVLTREGAYITTVSAWDGDKWIEISQRGDQTFGHDFPIETHKAYFVRNHEPISVSLVGRIAELDLADLNLKPGWNAVALPSDFPNAESLLDQLNTREAETAPEVDRWLSGNWQPFVKRSYTDTNTQSYGDNFAIDRRLGYFVQVNE